MTCKWHSAQMAVSLVISSKDHGHFNIDAMNHFQFTRVESIMSAAPRSSFTAESNCHFYARLCHRLEVTAKFIGACIRFLPQTLQEPCCVQEKGRHTQY
ncbi:hypothetical protein XELAEV_18020334mg [Xenopus laevis]|uniref:Uncharacterized protein n=1 Tax=Xenopus laevis TaxID=8355 RepID=A0A974D6U1_XENLA|nr:hypothetical protein XELAEV_18020334mg [Xenopus laevis]